MTLGPATAGFISTFSRQLGEEVFLCLGFEWSLASRSFRI